MEFIEYAACYKYQLLANYRIITAIKPPNECKLEFIQLLTDGSLTILEGYAWDGATGPVANTPSVMRGSVVHDSLYQLMREGLLDYKVFRPMADQLLHDICVEDGMNKAYAWIILKAVSGFGKIFADPKRKNPPIYAPKKPEAF